MTLEVIGNPQHVFQYALNQNSITIDKIVITQEEFISKIANPETIKALLVGCSQLTNESQFQKLLESEDVKEALKQPINPEILRQFSQSIQEFFSSFDQVELQNYSFMNSMNSQTYTVLIRTKNNVIYSAQNIDKNHLNSAFEEILTAFFYSTTTQLSIKELEFQFEIIKFEDYKKQFYLFKEGQKLELFSILAHPHPINSVPYQIKSEMFSSYQDSLFHYEAQLEQKFSREGVKMIFTPMNVKGKILEEQELVSIHQMTQNHNDIEIEGFISPKGKVEITYISSISKELQNTFKQGLLLHKSSKKYEDISVLPLHDIDAQSPNPKYVLIRNIGEYKTLIESSDIQEIDGIIITFSMFSSQLISLCKILDLDCIITKNQYQKALQTKINWETLEIDTPVSNSIQNNPFSSLLPKKSPEEVQSSQDMKRIQDELNASISKRSPIQSQQSHHRPMSTSNSNTYSKSSISSMSSSSSEKKGALAMLADQVLHQSSESEIKSEEREIQESNREFSNNSSNQSNNEYVNISENNSTIQSQTPSEFDMFSNSQDVLQQNQPNNFNQSSNVKDSQFDNEINTSTNNYSNQNYQANNDNINNSEVKELLTHLLNLKQDSQRKEEAILQKLLEKLN